MLQQHRTKEETGSMSKRTLRLGAPQGLVPDTQSHSASGSVELLGDAPNGTLSAVVLGSKCQSISRADLKSLKTTDPIRYLYRKQLLEVGELFHHHGLTRIFLHTKKNKKNKNRSRC